MTTNYNGPSSSPQAVPGSGVEAVKSSMEVNPLVRAEVAIFFAKVLRPLKGGEFLKNWGDVQKVFNPEPQKVMALIEDFRKLRDNASQMSQLAESQGEIEAAKRALVRENYCNSCIDQLESLLA